MLLKLLIFCCAVIAALVSLSAAAIATENSPEDDVGALGLVVEQVELLPLLLHPLDLVGGEVHQALDLALEAQIALGAPLQPELEDIVVAPALKKSNEDLDIVYKSGFKGLHRASLTFL